MQHILAVLTLIATAGGTAGAEENMDLKLAALFQDGCVLQQGKPAAVWGWCAPRTQVSAELDGAAAKTVSGRDGYFLLRLPALPAGGPYSLTVTAGAGEAARSITVNDVWLGEVFLFAGQSNAEFVLGSLSNFAELNRDGALCNPKVAYFGVPPDSLPVRSRDCEGRWEYADETNIGGFSAVGYRFGSDLADMLDTRVGIICAARGGSGVECWISPEKLLTLPPLAEKARAYLERKNAPDQYPDPEQVIFSPGQPLERALADTFPEVLENRGAEAGFHRADFDDSDWPEMELPDSWTLTGHNHAGVFWFRRSIDLPAEAAGKDAELSLGAVDKGDITYFNGVEIGRTGDGRDMNFWNTPRKYRVPGELVQAGRNVIAVRAASTVSIATDGGFIGPEDEMFLRAGDEKISLALPWKYCMEQDFGQTAAAAIPLAGPGEINTHGTLFENMIHPLLPYTMRGVLWYQGECNAIFEAGIYRELLGGMVDDWRFRWYDPQLDFMIVQLPGYQKHRRFSPHSTWARLREAQKLCALDKNAALVVTSDSGDENDLHPHDKFVVADRAARMAFARISGGSFPTPVAPETVRALPGGEVELIFSAPVQDRGEEADANGFAVVNGSGAVFYPDFRIDGDRILLSAPEGLPESGTVYYNWSNFPVGRLYDREGFPLSSFRAEFGE